MSHSCRDLLVWQKAKAFAVETYRVTAKFPGAERFGLTSQLRRAAVSIASNIAEGQGRMTRGEFQQFLGHARGSLLEVATQLEIAHELGYLTDKEFGIVDRHGRDVLGLLNRLIESLQARPVLVQTT